MPNASGSSSRSALSPPHRSERDHAARLGASLRLVRPLRTPRVIACTPTSTSSRSAACSRSWSAACDRPRARGAGRRARPAPGASARGPGGATSTGWQRRSRASTSRNSTASTTRRCRSGRSSSARARDPAVVARPGRALAASAGAIAEEHFFATYLRSKLGARLQHRMRYATGPRLVAACAPGEQHEIGLLLFALEARMPGCAPCCSAPTRPSRTLPSRCAAPAATQRSCPLRSIPRRGCSSARCRRSCGRLACRYSSGAQPRCSDARRSRRPGRSRSHRA